MTKAEKNIKAFHKDVERENFLRIPKMFNKSLKEDYNNGLEKTVICWKKLLTNKEFPTGIGDTVKIII